MLQITKKYLSDNFDEVKFHVSSYGMVSADVKIYLLEEHRKILESFTKGDEGKLVINNRNVEISISHKANFLTFKMTNKENHAKMIIKIPFNDHAKYEIQDKLLKNVYEYEDSTTSGDDFSF